MTRTVISKHLTHDPDENIYPCQSIGHATLGRPTNPETKTVEVHEVVRGFHQ